MEGDKKFPTQEQLLQIANMAFGVVASYRKQLPDAELDENIDYLEYALVSAFKDADPFISRKHRS